VRIDGCHRLQQPSDVVGLWKLDPALNEHRLQVFLRGLPTVKRDDFSKPISLRNQVRGGCKVLIGLL
jgi:hypothetical protein